MKPNKMRLDGNDDHATPALRQFFQMMLWRSSMVSSTLLDHRHSTRGGVSQYTNCSCMGEIGLSTLPLCQLQCLLDQQQVYKNSWRAPRRVDGYLGHKGSYQNLVNKFAVLKNENLSVDRFKSPQSFPNILVERFADNRKVVNLHLDLHSRPTPQQHGTSHFPR